MMRPPKEVTDYARTMLIRSKSNVEALKEDRALQLRVLTETDAKIREATGNIVALETWLRDAEVEAGE